PRAQQRGGDPGAGEFTTQPLGVVVHERLGGGVADLPREGLVARGGSDVEDRAAPARHHLLDRTSAQVDDGFDVDAHLGDLGVDGRLRHRPDGAHAGVVDQDVGGQPAPVDLVEETGPSGGIRDVAGDYLDADAVRQFGGQLACDVGADARRCAGHNGGAGG